MAFLSAFSAIQTGLHCIRRPEVARSHVLMAEKVRAALSSLSSLSMSVAPGTKIMRQEVAPAQERSHHDEQPRAVV